MYLWNLMVKGGYVMWPILACSFISFAIFFERMQVYRGVKGRVKETVIEPIKIGYTSIEQKELLQSSGNLFVNRLQDHLNYLEAIITIAPLLGLLGTVTGMITAFDVLSVVSGQPFAITGGVSEALIATATGLCVAIIALCLHTVLIQYQNNIVSELEYEADQFIKNIARGNDEV